MWLLGSTFADPQLEAEYKRERQRRLALRDMRSAAVFVLLWAYDVWRFLGRASIGELLKATVWLIAVGLKPVYVKVLVGPEFYLQYRAWIITFTKTVFAMHPPGEHLHLASLATAPAGGTSLPGLLWSLASGARLPYMVVTGLGWQDVLHNIPIQLALVGRAMKDMQAQCASPYYKAPQAQALLRGLADQLSATLSSLLRIGAGVSGLQDSFPAALDPCVTLGSWAAICFGFLLTMLALAYSEHRARARFARVHTSRLTLNERDMWAEGGGGLWPAWMAVAALLAFACMMVWQVLVSVLSWNGGKLMD